MSIAIIASGKSNLPDWQRGIYTYLANNYRSTTVEIWPNIAKSEEVDFVICWNHPAGILNNFPNLKVIASMGAGVDHVLRDKKLPKNIHLVRVVSPELALSMTKYILAQVLRVNKQLDAFANLQNKNIWGYTDTPEVPLSIGILGYGQLGQHLAGFLNALEFPVRVFTNRPKEADIPVYTHAEGIAAFLQNVNMVICLLPLTAETAGFLDKSFFDLCKPGTYLLNAARGKILNDTDLLQAINNGIIKQAILDVFTQEPLKPEHPYWNNANVIITPHISSITNPLAAIPQIAENYIRFKQGLPLKNLVNQSIGY